MSPELKFRSFFFLSPYSKQHFADWPRVAVGNYWLHRHPDLELTICKAKTASLWLLGKIIDPYNPTLSNQEILDQAAARTRNYVQLEENLRPLSGHWLIVAEIDGVLRIYPDACGTRSAFYHKDSSSGLWVASQPALLEYLGVTQKSSALAHDFKSQPHTGSWPVHVLPYDSVDQLVPNHYLDVHAQETIRFWPKDGDIPPRDITTAASGVLAILRGTTEGFLNRGTCALALTAGYDSRALLAAALPFRDNLRSYSVSNNNTPHYDKAVPKVISKRFNMKWKHYHINEFIPDPAVAETIIENVGGLYLDPSIPNIQTVAAVADNDTVLQGLAGEVLRGQYYKDKIEFSTLTTDVILKVTGFYGNPHAASGFSKWLKGAPTVYQDKLLDFLYWEHKLGVWAASSLACKGALINVGMPFNNRAALEIGLGVPLDERVDDSLVKEIIRQGDNKLACYEFNDHWLSRRLRTAPVPWRIKRRFRWV